jgi:hypothetical protein
MLSEATFSPKLDFNIHTHSVAFDASLVNTANISSMPVNTGTKHKKQISQFRLLGFAKKILTKHNVLSPRSKNPHRTRTCHSYKQQISKDVSIALSENPQDSRASIRDVQTCGCGWGCPVCYERLAVEKGLEIQKAIAWAKSEGLRPVLVALTAAHTNMMSLADFEQPFSKAYTKFTSNRRWRNFKQDFGVVHHIANRDLTYSDKNGWHFHKHMLLFINLEDRDISEMHEAMDTELTSWWIECLNKYGLSGKNEYAVHVSTHENASSDYLAKIGLTTEDDGTLHYEMTSSSTKDSRTIWDILMLANIGSDKNERLYVEYVEHMTGKNWITWSQGLHDLVDAFVPEIENEPETGQDNKMVKWISIGAYWWDMVKLAYAYDRLLNVAARTRDIEQIKELLRDIRYELYLDGKLWNREATIFIELQDPNMVTLHEDWKDESIRVPG